LPATVGRSIGNDALTNFVTSLQTNNLMTPGNRAVLHRYITQNFPGHVNPWFSEGTRWSGLGHVMGGLGLSQPTPHEDAAKAMMDYLNQGGAGIGTAPNIPSRLLSLFNMEI
jgi:hypothetical protein